MLGSCLQRCWRTSLTRDLIRVATHRDNYCVVPETRQQSLCSFSIIESAVAVQLNGAVFLL
jgi:hypothetical protein